MLETLLFSLAGTAVFAGVAAGLVYLMAALGGGSRAEDTRPAHTARPARRPGR
ncbi:MAG: hypothetical protein FJY97_08695 [candidate division Zixibacteria bacterium]|nr:hypothetical protein [candidate division Zixibacteria bacterium]